jgi:hypothetical protein
LINKHGEYDTVIQECEREIQQQQKAMMKNAQNIIEALNQGLQEGNTFLDHAYDGASSPVNPLKDFEDAKFASKSHGLITSYSANTH